MLHARRLLHTLSLIADTLALALVVYVPIAVLCWVLFADDLAQRLSLLWNADVGATAVVPDDVSHATSRSFAALRICIAIQVMAVLQQLWDGTT